MNRTTKSPTRIPAFKSSHTLTLTASTGNLGIGRYYLDRAAMPLVQGKLSLVDFSAAMAAFSSVRLETLREAWGMFSHPNEFVAVRTQAFFLSVLRCQVRSVRHVSFSDAIRDSIITSGIPFSKISYSITSTSPSPGPIQLRHIVKAYLSYTSGSRSTYTRPTRIGLVLFKCGTLQRSGTVLSVWSAKTTSPKWSRGIRGG
ncbi:hypothetical protein BCR39DRAFT_518967 [Naematelia encephala]|uniref:Uncharacterized protein n=1 Tax=Naematelia encephala TaxID=71784 RepID=A0A1Y2BG16_9TREE|nr:hypothetical protein BCR39DRAFT_518967 [Naematelia encephala]